MIGLILIALAGAVWIFGFNGVRRACARRMGQNLLMGDSPSCSWSDFSKSEKYTTLIYLAVAIALGNIGVWIARTSI